MSKSAIKDSIQQDQINFLKEGKKEDSSILRFALSFINKEEKDKRTELSDSEVVAVIKSLIKRNKDSYDQFTSANRPELAEKEKSELEIIQVYLPEQLSEEKTIELVKEVIFEISAESISDMGKVMSRVMQKSGGKVDGGIANRIAKELLQ